MKTARLLAAVMALTFALAAAAFAHTRSESFSSWQITGQAVHLQFIVPDLEAKRITRNGDMPAVDELGRYIAAHVGASSGDEPCALTEGPRPISSVTNFRRYEFTFECPSAAGIKVRSSAWFELVESHTNFAQIQDDKGNFVEQLISKDHQTLAVTSTSGASPLQYAGFLDFVRMGIMHIFTGVDHMSFMLGLVLISRRLRDLLFVVTGFHARPQPDTGACRHRGTAARGAIHRQPRRPYHRADRCRERRRQYPSPVAGRARPRWPFVRDGGRQISRRAGDAADDAPHRRRHLHWKLPDVDRPAHAIAARVRLRRDVLVFGLIHGFGFASDLLTMRLPTGRLAELLVGFNVGVEIGQVTVVLGALAAAYLLVKVRLGIPRAVFTDIAAAFLVGEGLLWFVSRTVVEG